MYAIEAGKITWVSKNRNWRLEVYPNHRPRIIWIVGQYHSQSAIVYDDGRVAYDNPDTVPKYVRHHVKQIAKYIHEGMVYSP